MFGIRTGKEAVELHQELEVDIVALGSRAMAVLDVMAIEIDTWRKAGSALLLIGYMYFLLISKSNLPMIAVLSGGVVEWKWSTTSSFSQQKDRNCGSAG